MQEVFMKRALALAKKGLGMTSPNPCVGAVVVKGGQIVGEGWHQYAGGDHAEVLAIRDVMSKSGIVTVDIAPELFHNATLYVTLEPCSHVGRTPACAKTIVEAGFKKVCVGMKDPFKRVNGKGINFLKKHGVKVEVLDEGKDLAHEIRKVNQPFIKTVSLGLPHVTLKAGMSLDGKIATSEGDSRWITGQKSRSDAKVLRSMCDCVVVGSNTVKRDDCLLAASGKFAKRPLLRVIIDRKLSSPLESKVFRDELVFVATTDLASVRNRVKFAKAGVKFKSFGREIVSVKKLLQYLAGIGVQSVFVEGGGFVHGSFFDAGMVDQVVFYVAPKLIGGTASVIGGNGVAKIAKASVLLDFACKKIDDDLRIEGFLNFY